MNNGYIHREGGPAYRNFHGDEVYFKRGKFHRLNGPAVCVQNDVRYFVEGKEIDKLLGFFSGGLEKHV